LDTRTISDVCARWYIQNGAELEQFLKSSFGVEGTIRHYRRYQAERERIVGKSVSLILVDDIGGGP
jgi:hypothetical protein